MSARRWDISQTLRPDLPVWPGDTAFSHRARWTMTDGSPVNVAAFETTVHAGAHADAPLHYQAGGASAADVGLDAYLGPCQVVDATRCGAFIDRDFVGRVLPAPEARVLFRTFSQFPTDTWPETFTAVDAAAITYLASRGVVLIGVDAPSLDPQTSKTMDAHKAILAADMRVLEGLVLDDVPPGRYELIALPLKLAGLDASPVRAVLRALSDASAGGR
jgi:arylformamidase